MFIEVHGFYKKKVVKFMKNKFDKILKLIR